MCWWTDARPLALAMGLAILGCRAVAPPHWFVPVPLPAEAFPNAVTDDGNAVRSMSEGGQSDQPYVVDGTVELLTEHSLVIQTDELGQTHLYVNRHTEITLDRRPARLADLRPGVRIRAAYSPTHLAWALQAGEGATSDDAPRG